MQKIEATALAILPRRNRVILGIRHEVWLVAQQSYEEIVDRRIRYKIFHWMQCEQGVTMQFAVISYGVMFETCAVVNCGIGVPRFDDTETVQYFQIDRPQPAH